MVFEILRQFHLFISGIHAVGGKPQRWPFGPLTAAPLYWMDVCKEWGLRAPWSLLHMAGLEGARFTNIQCYPLE